MQKIDKVVLRETGYIASVVAIFSLLLQAVFLIIGKWSLPVLLGNLLSGAAVILNFLFMGIAVQGALGVGEKEAKQKIQASGALRMVFLFAVCACGVLLDCFSNWTVIIPMFFPRIAVALRPVFLREKTKEVDDEK